MDPTFLLAPPAIASAMGLPAAPQLAPAAQGFTGQLVAEVTSILAMVNAAVVDIVRVAYVTCLLLGVLLYFTHVARRLGKDLIVGGILLIVITEFLLPAVASLIG